MRRVLVVCLWVIATLGVTYVANAAVELVDSQVFPEGSLIQVESLPEKEELATPPVTSALIERQNSFSLAGEESVDNSTVLEEIAEEKPLKVTSSLAIVDSETVTARVGSEFKARIAAGGSTPYKWELLSGSLPDGLSLTKNGFLEGIPLLSGQFDLSVKVSDDLNSSIIGSISLNFDEYKNISSRGGSVTVRFNGESVSYFSALHKEGFDPPQIVRTGPLMVEVLFIPILGDDTSWVRCEVDVGIFCSSD